MDHSKYIETQPVLCIFIRNDMKSMNPGKAAAQASHCASMLEKTIHKPETSDAVKTLHEKWSGETSQGFGTALTFSIKEKDMKLLDDLYQGDMAFQHSIFEICHDPTYPIQDGEVTHYIPINTGCYFFFDAAIIGGKPGKYFREKGIDMMK